MNELIEFFNKHWANKPHKCESCGAYLGRENKTIFHDHLLERSKYPQFKLDMRNMYLVCLKCHDEKTRGFPTANHKKAIESAKELLLG